MHEASYVSSEVSSPSGNYLHRRFSVDGKQCTDSGGNRFIGSEHILTSRFSNQREEILPSTDSINHVLGLRERYSTDDSFFTTRESLSNFQRNSKFTSSSTTQTSFCTTCHTCRSCCSCCLPMSLVWKETKRSIASSSNILREKWHYLQNIFRTNYGIKTVDSKYTISQLEPCIVSRSGYDYNHIYTSKIGWGMNQPRASGRWSSENTRFHINFLELKAVWFVLMTLANQVYGQNIQIQVDNRTAVTYLNHMGGTQSLI